MSPKPRQCRGCAHERRGRGFAKDHVPRKWPPRAAYLLEAPGSAEVGYQDPDDRYGRPLMGPAGELWEDLCIHPVGLERHSVMICNTLRCRPPGNIYPTELMRVNAERTCRQYDTDLERYDPTVCGVTYHPAACFRVPAYRAFIERAAEKVARHIEAGERPLLIMGLKGFQAAGLEWLREGCNVDGQWSMKRLQGHWWRLKEA